MDIYQEIFAQAKKFNREELSPEEQDALFEMGKPAYIELCSRLKPEFTPESIMTTLITACALLALSFYVSLNLENIEELSAGYIRAKRRTPEATRELADSLRRQAELIMTGQLQDRSFSFRTVR